MTEAYLQISCDSDSGVLIADRKVVEAEGGRDYWLTIRHDDAMPSRPALVTVETYSDAGEDSRVSLRLTHKQLAALRDFCSFLLLQFK